MAEARECPTLLGRELALKVAVERPYSVNPNGDHHVVVVDFGVKSTILHYLVKSGFKVSVVPGETSFEQVMALSPDGIFLSNGPGDPFATFERVGDTIKKFLDKNIPLFGICLGHQLLGLAEGLNTLKLHRGHRGGNHPVKNLSTGQVEITSQNHGFAVSKENIPDSVEITHESLFDHTVEGIRFKDKDAFAVQYHPESSPGPHDSHYLFGEFRELIETAKRRQRSIHAKEA